MKYDPMLPVDFDGTFRFTNWTDEDFTGVWGSKEYLYPKHSTSPMIIPDQTPVEIQHIRKKFAKDLAEREFFKSPKYETFRLREGEKDDMGMIKPRGYGMSHAGAYTINDLTPYIQRCLEPLPISKAIVTEVQKDKVEDKLTRDDEGNLNTEAIDRKTSLRDKALKS